MGKRAGGKVLVEGEGPAVSKDIPVRGIGSKWRTQFTKYRTKANRGPRSMHPNGDDGSNPPSLPSPELPPYPLSLAQGDCRHYRRKWSPRPLPRPPFSDHICHARRPTLWVIWSRTTTPPLSSGITSYGGGRSDAWWPHELRESLGCHPEF